MTRNEKSSRAYVLSSIAGILIIVNTGLLGAAATWFPQIIPTILGSPIDTAGLYRLTAIGLTIGVLVFLGAIMLRVKPENKVWGVIVVGFSVCSVITGGGFIVGSILGVIGGASSLTRKPGTQSTKPET